MERIIPARAGFTAPAGPPPKRLTDHPRSRGVYPSPWRSSSTSTGSSPLARGLQYLPDGPVRSTRIIPARAGFTGCGRSWRCGRSDHPRSRGVYERANRIVQAGRGSSPLARGLLEHDLFRRYRRRIIPARAGFTARPSSTLTAWRDHPRSRGVYMAGKHASGRFTGSSPLARGLPDLRVTTTGNAGIIPARAGFTLADPRNPNDELPYQAMFTFTADLALAPQSSDSAVVSQRSTTTPSEA